MNVHPGLIRCSRARSPPRTPDGMSIDHVCRVFKCTESVLGSLEPLAEGEDVQATPGPALELASRGFSGLLPAEQRAPSLSNATFGLEALDHNFTSNSGGPVRFGFFTRKIPRHLGNIHRKV